MSYGDRHNLYYLPNKNQYNSYQPSNTKPLPLIPLEIGKSFANQLKQLQTIEHQLLNYKQGNKSFPNFPQLNSDKNNETSLIDQECQSKKALHEQKTDKNLKDKLEAMKEVKSITINEAANNNFNKIIREEDYVPSKKAFKSNMTESLSNICNSIKSNLNVEQNKSTHLIEEIKKSIIEMKNGLSNQINNYGLKSNECLNEIKKVMLKGKGTRLRYLTKKLFPNGETEKEIEDEERKEEEEKHKKHELRRMSVLLDQNNVALLEARKNAKDDDLHIKLHEISNYSSDSNNSYDSNRNESKELDFRQLYKREDDKLLKSVTTLILQSANSKIEMKPINKFRAYVYFLIGAKRIINIQYIIYSRIKFDAVHYFIDNYEDMDIIIKKLMYNSMRPVILNILNNKEFDINIVKKKPNAHDLFLILKKTIENMIEGLSKDFFMGVSENMLTYLSLFLSNYSYIPRDFFTTFELLRFNTTKTGEFINMQRDQQRMILGFYLIIQILLKNIFLELSFNHKSINTIDRRTKLNIKMLVTIIYRGIMDEFKKCETQRNITEIEEEENINNYCRICFTVRDFALNLKVVRKRLKIRKLHINNDKGNQSKFRESTQSQVKIGRSMNNDIAYENDFHYTKIKHNQAKGVIKKGMTNANLVKEKAKVKKAMNNDNNDLFTNKPNRNTSKGQFNVRHKRNHTVNQGEHQQARMPPQQVNFPPLNSNRPTTSKVLSAVKQIKKKKNNKIEYFSKASQLNQGGHHKKSKSLVNNSSFEFSKKKNNNKPLYPSNYLSEFSDDERSIMEYIMTNLQPYGDDSDPNEFELIDTIVYQKEFLQTYDLFKEEYNFDPITPIMDFLDKLLNMIIKNFNKDK